MVKVDFTFILGLSKYKTVSKSVTVPHQMNVERIQCCKINVIMKSPRLLNGPV